MSKKNYAYRVSDISLQKRRSPKASGERRFLYALPY